MQVKLLRDYERNGRVKVVTRPGRTPVAYYKDTEVSVSDLTGRKWIDAGIAVPVLQPESKDALPAGAKPGDVVKPMPPPQPQSKAPPGSKVQK
jgi:hypothetical protein